MLLRFSVENFKSFKQRAEFSMLPSRVKSHPAHVIRAKNAKDISVLKSSIIYGANASGKSNLIKAMRHAQAMVVEGSKLGKNLPYEPFRLDETCGTQPTRFEFEIKSGKQNYAYGFSADHKTIYEEWLFEINKSGETPVFERSLHNNQSQFDFGPLKFNSKEDEQFLQFTAKGTPANRLFLAECYERNVLTNLSYLTAFVDVSYWFHEKLNIVFPNSKYHGLEMQLHVGNDNADMLAKILNEFDTGIAGLSLKEIDFSKEIPDIPTSVKQDILQQIDEKEAIFVAGPRNTRYQFVRDETGQVKAFKLMTKHVGADGKDVFFDIFQESDGTQRLLDIAPGLLDIFSEDKVYIIDEIDRSLHSEITTSLLNTFLTLTCDVQSQLIVTTHESNLLNLDMIRRDEVWFTQKDKQGATSLYSLEEFQPRFDNDIRKGYLVGRFGGVPVIKDLFSDFKGANCAS